MLEFLSRLLVAGAMSFPFLLVGTLCVLFPEQMQDLHIKGNEARYKRFPLLKWLDPFRGMMYAPSAPMWNRIVGFYAIGLGVLTFVMVLFE